MSRGRSIGLPPQLGLIPRSCPIQKTNLFTGDSVCSEAMTDADKESEFLSITGSTAASAKFYLDMCRGDVSAAVQAYYDATDAGGPSNDSSGASGSELAAASSNPSVKNESSSDAAGGGRITSKNRGGSSRRDHGRGETGGIATLASLGRDDSDEEDESGKNFYAGGGKSGQMIQDPRKSNGGGGDGDEELASKIFERASQKGPLTDAEREEFNEVQSFTGAGYRLGQEETTGPSRPHVIGRRNVTRTLTFYSNGFTVDDGDLRRLDDPRNESFLRDINDGIVPHEMEEPGIGNVSINLVDKKNEEYIPPKSKLVPFSGGGQRLGSGTDATAAPSALASSQHAAGVASPELPAVDESRPVATVQVRLSDGTRLKVRLNEDATVGDLRQYVYASRPGVPSFTLATTFPRKVLTDDEATLKDANLNGSVVVQTPC